MSETRALAGRLEVRFSLNGAPCAVTAWPLARLLDVLREHLGATGTKEGCGEGECGACSVLLDGQLVNACLVPILQVAGREVLTIEGIAADPRWDALRHAFVAQNGTQCGMCTPGMILASVALLREKPSPTEEQIREGLSGNLCRCTGYVKIVAAVQEAAARMDGGAR